MKARIKKWGNSLALRIPKSIAEEANLSENTPVEIQLANGKLSIKAVSKKRWNLRELLRGITDENLHDAWDTGKPVGKELL